MNIFKSVLFRLGFKPKRENVLLKNGSLVSKKAAINTSSLFGKLVIQDNCNIENSFVKGEVVLHQSVELKNSTLSGQIIIGEDSLITQSKIYGEVETKEKCKIISGVELHGKIVIGRYTSINGPNTDMYSQINPITIGNFCSIARHVTFQEYNHDAEKVTSYFFNHNILGKNIKEDIISKGSITIEHDVWIGTHCVILSGVTIGTGAVIAANTVVFKDVPPYAIVGGSPARVLKYRFSEEIISKLLTIKWWNWDIKKINRNGDLFQGNLTEEKLNHIID